eukprot:scaffold1798_cov248-Pinguiococcus_pyrenoidosus.AAC.2
MPPSPADDAALPEDEAAALGVPCAREGSALGPTGRGARCWPLWIASMKGRSLRIDEAAHASFRTWNFVSKSIAYPSYSGDSWLLNRIMSKAKSTSDRPSTSL